MEEKLLIVVMIGLLLIFGTAAVAGMENDHAVELNGSGDSTEILETEEKELKNKTFYMYRVEDAVDVGPRMAKEIYNTTYPEGSGNETELSSFRVFVNWYLHPQLAGDLQLDGTSTLSVWARSPQTGGVDMTYEIRELYEDGSEEMISQGSEGKFIEEEWTSHQVSIEIDNHTVSEDSTLKVTLDMWGDAASQYQIAYGGHVEGEEDFVVADTNVTLPCLDYMRVEDVYTRDHEGTATNLFDPEAENKNITIHANVTNPFGGYDIQWVNVSLKGPDGEVKLDNVSMNKTHGEFDSFTTRYKLRWNYEAEPEGTYNVEVRAVDRNGKRAFDRTGSFQGHQEYGHHSFVIGGLDHYVNLKLEDNQGYILENTTVNLKPGPDTVFNSKETDQDGIVNFTVAEATYLITVNWQDVEVQTNRTLDVGAVGNRTRDDPYNLTAAIFYPEFTVLDEEDQPVDDANIYLTHPNGTDVLPPYTTDEDGTFSLNRAAEGNYSLEIRWKGREVGTFEVGLDWTSIDQTIHVNVYHLTVQVQDHAGQPVSDALVVFSYNDTFQTAESLMTDPDGDVYTRLPGTEYLLEVHWNDAKVYEDTYLLDTSDHITITADIFEVTVEINDDLDEPLLGAEVTATYTATEREIGTETTDDDGIVAFQLAGGEHRFEVTWLGTEVAEETRTVDEENTHFEISASVYQLEIVALDNTPDQEPLNGAYISVRIDGDLVDTGETDEVGSYITKLPETYVDVDVEWKGIHVYSLEDYWVEDNKDEELFCSVYYLDLEVQDSREEPIQGAEVNIMYGASTIERGTTDENGLLRVRLPVEEYLVRTTWYGVEVNETNYQMIEEQEENELIIHAAVYYLDIEVIDDQGEVLEDASVEFYLDDSLLFTEVTREDGKVERRLPAESYQIHTVWRGFTVDEMVISVDSDQELTVGAAVYHVDFTPVDSKGEMLGNAYLEIIHEGSVFEGAEAPVSTRLPEGEFRLEVTWQGVEVYDEIHQIDRSEEMDLSCDVYYLTLSGIDSREEEVTDLTVSVYHEDLPDGQDLLTTMPLDEKPTERFPAGDLRLQAEWRGFIVAEDVEVELEEDRSFEIECDIYYLDLTVLDSEEEPLHGANIVIKEEDETVLVTKVTEDGIATPTLPSGTWTLEAYWMDRYVGTHTTEIEDEDQEIVFEVDVHPLQATVVDSEDRPLQNAEINLLDHDGNLVFSRATDEDGTIGYEQLPGGDWSLEVFWMDRNVGYTTVQLTEKEEITLETEVYDLHITVEDSEEQILEGAEVSLLDGDELIYSEESDEEGDVSFEQIASGEWMIEINWQRVRVLWYPIEDLNETETMTLETDVHTLYLDVVDSEGDALHEAEIVLYGPRDELVYSRDSDGDGSTFFVQLPGGDWDIEVYWADHEVATVNVTLEESERRTIVTDVHNLSVLVLDNEGEPLEGAEVTLMDDTGLPLSSRETNEGGRVYFSQLVEEDYTLRTRYRTTYLLTDVDMEEETPIALDSSQESEVTISDYPLPFYATNLFYTIMILLAVAIVGIVLIARKKEVI